MGDHRRKPFQRSSTVDVAVAPPHRPRRRSKIGSRAVEDGFTEGRASGLITDQGGKDIPSPFKAAPKRGTDGLLALAQINATHNLARLVEAGEFGFQMTRLQHRPVNLARVIPLGGKGRDIVGHGLRLTAPPTCPQGV